MTHAILNFLDDNIHLQQILTESGFITDDHKPHSRTGSSSHTPPNENANLKQILRESAFMSDTDGKQVKNRLEPN